MADSTQGTDELSIDLLIGADFYWQSVTKITVRGQEPGPVALPTRLGYVLSAPVGISPSSPENSMVNFTETRVVEICTSVYDEKTALDQQVRRFWDLETKGSSKKNKLSMRSSSQILSTMGMGTRSSCLSRNSTQFYQTTIN